LIPSGSDLLEVFQWGDSILQKYGNEGFNMVKMWEPLLIGFILKSYPDPLVDNTKFYNLMRIDFLDAAPSDREWAESHMKSLESILDRQVGNPNFLTQLHGLYRIWGHPSINGIASVNRLI